MNKTEKLILESVRVLLFPKNHGEEYKRDISKRIYNLLEPKENKLAEQREEDLKDGSLNANKEKEK